MNYQEILLAQSNKFLFRVSQEPFNYLKDFITNILEPPLIKIKEQYDLVEKLIFDTISDSVDNFPDYTGVLKDILGVENIFNYINELYYIIKDLLVNYGNDLDINTIEYINKLIHFTYINGLNTYDESCNYSFCFMDINYNNTNVNNENNVNNNNYRKKSVNKTRRYDNLEINKKIYNSNKLNYNEEMGALSKDDVIYILIETKNIISQLNSSLQINFDPKIKSKLQNYLAKINGTRLIKLKKSISMTALKFSTFLTKNSYKVLEENMFKKYYILENFVFNFSSNLQKETYELITNIKKSSKYLLNINNYIYDKILGFYDLFIKLIDNKYSSISSEEYRNYQKRRLQNNNNNNNKRKRKTKDDKKKDDDIYEIENPNVFDYKTLKYFQQKFDAIRNNQNQLGSKVIGIMFEEKKHIIGGLLVDLFREKGENEENEEDDEEPDLEMSITVTL